MKTRIIFHRLGLAKTTAQLCIAALLFLPALAQALDLGSSTSRTPYDPYMGPVFSVFGRLGGAQPDAAQVEQWVREGRAFRYSFNKSEPYRPQTPQQTESSRAGDCKAKSLWLASKMDTRKVRYVIGKAKRVSNMSHAWLIWEGPDGWLILDATLYSKPLDANRVSSNEFLPIYSYAPSGKYAHARAAARGEEKYADHL
jgi:hypothetical protein